MNAGLSRALSVGAVFLVIFATGFWLSRSGKPYSGILFNVHKLIALGALVFLGITVSRIHREQGLQPGQTAAVAAAGLCFVVTIITGGLSNIEKALPAVVTVLHRVFPYLTALASAGALYLLRFAAP